MQQMKADFIVIGAGLAGLVSALELARAGDVVLIAKTAPQGSNSAAAQGGIAAALAAGDHPALHAQDTLAAGAGLCSKPAVDVLTRTAPSAIEWLAGMGVPFDRDPAGYYHLGLEGAHARSRIVHAAGDATGAAVIETLWQRAQETPRLTAYVPCFAAALVLDDNGEAAGVCVQAAFGTEVSGTRDEPMVLWARRAVFLATGGACALYARTTNPGGATGDGIALAYRAGLAVCNMEFIQFHPTALALDGGRAFLISEAVRGAGAMLMEEDGRPLDIDHPLRELAPRDVLARTVYRAVQAGRRVLLDARGVRDFEQRFPTIWRACRERGLDPRRQPIPVAPAAHFLMGGVAADISGRTEVPRLYAVGETACTGVHGANRLASNSLLECVVTARLAAADAAGLLPRAGTVSVSQVRLALRRRLEPDPPEVLERVRALLWTGAGLVRSEKGLRAASRELERLAAAWPRSGAVTVARLIVDSALVRRESRGAHYRIDWPHPDPALAGHDTVMRRDGLPQLRTAGDSPACRQPVKL